MDREPREISFNLDARGHSTQPRWINGEIRLPSLREPIRNFTPSTTNLSALELSSPQNFDLRLDPYHPSQFETTFQNYVKQLNSTFTTFPTDSSISAVASALAEKLHLDNHRLLSVLIIDAALIPSTSIGSPRRLPARAPDDVTAFARFYSLSHFTKQTCFRTFFILKNKSFAVHLFYHLKVTFEFDYSAEKFRGRDAPQNPDIFRYSIVPPKVTLSTIVKENGRNYVKKLEFNPGPSVDRFDPL